MSKLPRWTASDAERELRRAGFEQLRSKGSHRIYGKGGLRIVVPFHTNATLHPKIVKQVVEVISEAASVEERRPPSS